MNMPELTVAKQQHEKFMWEKLLNYYKEPRVAHILLESGKININDQVIIMGETTGVIEIIMKEFYVNDNLSEYATKGDEVTFESPTLIRRNDKVYKIESMVDH